MRSGVPMPSLIQRVAVLFSFKPTVLVHTDRILFTPVRSEIKSKDAFVIAGPLQHLAMAQRAARVMIAGPPMLLHAQPRELVVLGMAFVALGPINQMNDAAFMRWELYKTMLRHILQDIRGCTRAMRSCVIINRWTWLVRVYSTSFARP